MKCPNCGLEIEDLQEDACPRCKAQLKVVCVECGGVSEGRSNLCQACGVPFTEETPLVSPAEEKDFSGEKERPAPPPAPAGQSGKGKKILAVDNDKDVLEIIRKLLEIKGYEVVTASSGPEGIKKARETVPDLITLDVLMHLLNGFEVLKFLKKTKETKEIPVIIVSCLQESEAEKKALELGASGYLRKPFEREVLYKEIEKHLKKSS